VSYVEEVERIVQEVVSGRKTFREARSDMLWAKVDEVAEKARRLVEEIDADIRWWGYDLDGQVAFRAAHPELWPPRTPEQDAWLDKVKYLSGPITDAMRAEYDALPANPAPWTPELRAEYLAFGANVDLLKDQSTRPARADGSKPSGIPDVAINEAKAQPAGTVGRTSYEALMRGRGLEP